MGDMVSPHFSMQEMECPHCHTIRLNQRLLPALEKLRNLVNTPIIIKSAYRCAKHNADVGGVKNSEHVQGMAADLVIVGFTLQQMFDAAMQIDEFRNGGIGVYDGEFIHVDVRMGEARWARVDDIYGAITQLVKTA